MPSFFKPREYNVFDYRPRYYDPDKEERHARLNALRREQGKSELDDNFAECKPGSSIRGSFRTRYSRKTKSSKNAKMRFYLILLLLCGVMYLILRCDFTSIVRFLSR